MSELENKNGVFKSDLMRTFRQLKESRAEYGCCCRWWSF